MHGAKYGLEKRAGTEPMGSPYFKVSYSKARGYYLHIFRTFGSSAPVAPSPSLEKGLLNMLEPKKTEELKKIVSWVCAQPSPDLILFIRANPF